MKEERTKEESIKKDREKEEDASSLVSAEPQNELSRQELKIDWPAFIAWINNTLDKYKSTIPRVDYITIGYQHRIQGIVNAYGSKKVVTTAVEKLARSDFLNGRVKGVKRRFTVIWLFKHDENFEEVRSGAYDNPIEPELSEAEKRQQAEEQRQREAEERRRRNNEIDRQIKAEQRRAREEAHAHRATPEELEEIFKNFKLPPLKAEPK